MIKYRLREWGDIAGRIEKVEAERETNSFIVFKNGRRDAKNAGGHCYFDTFEMARRHMFNSISKKLDQAQKNVEILRGQLGEAFTLEEPIP